MARQRRGGCLGGPFRLIWTLICLGIMAFVGLFVFLLIKEHTIPRVGDYKAMIVLGAQVNPDGKPSVQLELRLEKALEAYQKKPVPIVVTGGQGQDEPRAEALVMRDWLVSKGVPPQAISTDETSENSSQNIKNAMGKLPYGIIDVLIVTSDYHLPRAMRLAQDQGLLASGMGSAIKPEYWIKNHVRETLAWGKYFVNKVIPLP